MRNQKICIESFTISAINQPNIQYFFSIWKQNIEILTITAVEESGLIVIIIFLFAKLS